MALDKAALANSLETLFKANITNLTNGQQAQINTLCSGMADAIDVYIKAATITYTSGLTAPNGPVAGVFGGNLN